MPSKVPLPRHAITATAKRPAPSLNRPTGLGHLARSPELYASNQGPFLVPVKLYLPDEHWLLVYAMIDFRAACCFIDTAFMEQHQIPLQPKETPVLVEAIDGHLLCSGLVTQETCTITLQIHQHLEHLQFDVITYVPQTQNRKADALSQKPEYTHASTKEAPVTTILPPLFFAATSTCPALTEKIRDNQAHDPWAQERLWKLQDGSAREFTAQDGLLLYNKQLYVPPGPLQMEFLNLSHDATLAGHFSQHKMTHLLTWKFWWP
ncbi:UNVERIFIED_CONTAM: hypothetical protein K2H54_045474 [Gekko kuhli]